jgi:hypothetical protein
VIDQANRSLPYRHQLPDDGWKDLAYSPYPSVYRLVAIEQGMESNSELLSARGELPRATSVDTVLIQPGPARATCLWPSFACNSYVRREQLLARSGVRVIVRFVALTLVALTGSTSAYALDVPVDGNGTAPSVEGPIMTNDGSVVVGLGSARPRVDVVAFSPMLDSRRTLTSFGRQPKGYELNVALSAAGDGLLVATANVSPAGHCCSRTYLRASLSWYPSVSQPARVIRSCPEPCGSYLWTPPLYFTSSDGERVVIVDPTGLTVRDLASGTETPVQFDNVHNQPGDAEEPQIAGSYLSYPSAGEVVNWQTGEVVHHVPSVDLYGLLADGTLIYADHGGLAWKPKDHFLHWAPGEAKPTPYPRPGQLLAVAGGRVLVKTTSGLQIWTLDGTVVETFDPNPSADYFADPYSEHYAFNGIRLATVQASCLTVRIDARHAGQPAATALPKSCATPVPVSASLSRHDASVKVHCPRRYAQGCIGTVSLNAPWAPGARPRMVKLRPGKAATLQVAHWKADQVCDSIRRAKHWRLTVRTPNWEGRLASTTFRVSRRVECGRPGS